MRKILGLALIGVSIATLTSCGNSSSYSSNSNMDGIYKDTSTSAYYIMDDIYALYLWDSKSVFTWVDAEYMTYPEYEKVAKSDPDSVGFNPLRYSDEQTNLYSNYETYVSKIFGEDLSPTLYTIKKVGDLHFALYDISGKLRDYYMFDKDIFYSVSDTNTNSLRFFERVDKSTLKAN